MTSTTSVGDAPLAGLLGLANLTDVLVKQFSDPKERWTYKDKSQIDYLLVSKPLADAMTGKPQGQWGSRSDLDHAGDMAGPLSPGEHGSFPLPPGHSSVVHTPEGATVPATNFWVRNNGSGTFHGYPTH